MSDEPKYRLYYAQRFPITELEKWHRGVKPESQLAEFIDDITQHIAKFGIRNPVGVFRRAKGAFDVRPGKCRVTAHLRLGYDSIPAIIADYSHLPPEPDWERLPYDPEYIQERFLSGDCVVEMNRRFFNIKKNVDVVHRPGVKNAFRKELDDQ